MKISRIAAASAGAVNSCVKASVVFLTTAVFASVSAVGSDLELYQSEADFLANAPIESTMNFDDASTPTYVKHWSFTYDEVVYEISAGSDAFCWYVGYENCWYMTDSMSDGPPPPTSPNMLASDVMGPMDGEAWDVISFGENRFVTAIGFYFISANAYDGVIANAPDFAGWEMIVHETDGSATTFDLPPDTAMAPAYYGFVSDIGISRIEIGNKSDQCGLNNFGYDSVSRSAVTLVSQEIGEQMTIAVHPKAVNPISQNLVEVDVLSQCDFDATAMSIPGVFFGPGEAKVLRYRTRDIDGDGLDDLRLWFRIYDTGIRCGDTQATLIARDLDWNPLFGTDWINTVRCE